jgi:hypothetical protein
LDTAEAALGAGVGNSRSGTALQDGIRKALQKPSPGGACTANLPIGAGKWTSTDQVTDAMQENFDAEAAKNSTT